MISKAAGTDSAFGLADQTVGANYRLLPKPDTTPGAGLAPAVQPQVFSLDLQVQLDFPAYNTTSQTTGGLPPLGDGSLDVTGGAFATLPLGQLWGGNSRIVGGGGFTYRTGGFSSALPWSVGFQYDPREMGWLFSLGANGIFSLKSDSTVGSSTSGSSTFFVGA